MIITAAQCLFCFGMFGQDNLLDGRFWEMGRFHLLGRQNNLLGGQLPVINLPVTSSPCRRDKLCKFLDLIGQLLGD